MTARAPRDKRERLRLGYLSEQPLRLTVTAPPVTYTWDGRDMISEEEPAAELGMNLSAAMVRLLGHYDGYGLQYPVRRALQRFRRECAGKHRNAPDHRGQPTCYLIAFDVIAGGTSLLWAADQHGVSYPRAERMLLSAVQKMSGWIEHWESLAA